MVGVARWEWHGGSGTVGGVCNHGGRSMVGVTWWEEHGRRGMDHGERGMVTRELTSFWRCGQ